MRASLAHAHRDFHHRLVFRSASAFEPGQGSQRGTEAYAAAEIVLLTADALGTVEIMRRTGKSKTRVWRWQERFMAAGFEGLLRDKTRPSRIPPLGAEVAASEQDCLH